MKKLTTAKLLLASLTLVAGSAMAAQGTVYKSPYCGCCKEWVKYMEDHGYEIEVVNMENLNPIKAKLGLRPQLASCHTAVIDGYVFEGHIPVEDINSFLAKKPKLAGLAVPGMPMGSPGMEYGNQKDAYNVLGFTKSGMTMVYNKHNQ